MSRNQNQERFEQEILRQFQIQIQKQIQRQNQQLQGDGFAALNQSQSQPLQLQDSNQDKTQLQNKIFYFPQTDVSPNFTLLFSLPIPILYYSVGYRLDTARALSLYYYDIPNSQYRQYNYYLNLDILSDIKLEVYDDGDLIAEISANN